LKAESGRVAYVQTPVSHYMTTVGITKQICNKPTHIVDLRHPPWIWAARNRSLAPVAWILLAHMDSVCERGGEGPDAEATFDSN